MAGLPGGKKIGNQAYLRFRGWVWWRLGCRAAKVLVIKLVCVLAAGFGGGLADGVDKRLESKLACVPTAEAACLAFLS